VQLSSTSSAATDRIQCDLGAVLQTARRLYMETIDARTVAYVPDFVGMPILLKESEVNVLNAFSSGAPVGEAIAGLQGSIAMPFPTLVKTIAEFESLGFLRSEGTDEPRCKPPALPAATSMRSMNVWLHINNECNLECAYCFVTKTRSTMQEDTIRVTIDRLAHTVRKYRLEELVIKLAGGEPTMRMDLIEMFRTRLTNELAGEAVRVRWAFITNGTICSSRLLDFVKVADAGINISLDGFGEYHDRYRIYKTNAAARGIRDPKSRGSWDRIAANIDRFIANGIIPNINTTVSRESAPGLRELTRWVSERDMRLHFGVVRNLDCDWTDGAGRRARYAQYCDTLAAAFEEAFLELERPQYPVDPASVDICELRFDRPSGGVCCGIGSNHIVLREDGNLASCPMTLSEQSVTPTDDLFESSRRTFSVDPNERGDQGDCLACEWYRVCSNGCPVANTRFNGHPFTKSPLCQFWKYVIPRYVRFHGRKLAQTQPISSACAELQ